MNKVVRLGSICIYPLQIATMVCILTHHFRTDEDISQQAYRAATVLSILTDLIVIAVSVIKYFYQQDLNIKKRLLYSISCTTVVVSSLLNICLKKDKQISIVALSCIIVMHLASFIFCFILFELQKRCFSLSHQEEEAIRLHQIPEPQSQLAILISKMQREQNKLNQNKARLSQLEHIYQNTLSPALLTSINDTNASIQESMRKISDFRLLIQNLDEDHRLPPPPYSLCLNPGERRSDSNMAIVISNTETTIEREQEIFNLERIIRSLQFRLDIIALKLNTEGLSEEEKKALLLEREEVNNSMKMEQTKLSYLLEPSILPKYSPQHQLETIV